jgi:uncharacterized RDD family membrane protein YckC
LCASWFRELTDVLRSRLMPCPICGDACNCTPPYHARRQARTRFRPAADPNGHEPHQDFSNEARVLPEQEIPGGDQPAGTSKPRFIVSGIVPTDELHGSGTESCHPSADTRVKDSAEVSSENRIVLDAAPAEALPSAGTAMEPESQGLGNPQLELPPEEWRQELAARLHHYHSRRRRRPPRYPSLSLKFDPPENPRPNSIHNAEMGHNTSGFHGGGRSDSATAAARQEVASAPALAEPRFDPCHLLLDSTNLIEFPRPLLPPPHGANELADPVTDKPRILDAPEAVPQQVPLGGIILEAQDPLPRPELELPLQVAPLSLRLTASLIDVGFVLTATLMFAAIFSRMSPLAASSRMLLGLGVLSASLWAIYQYLFLVHTGSTPGLQLVSLAVTRFAGGLPSRGARRFRALAMALSALSMGLGFFWCLLDADTLCWHDRITHTYLTRSAAAPSGTIPGSLKQTLRDFLASFMAGLRIGS